MLKFTFINLTKPLKIQTQGQLARARAGESLIGRVKERDSFLGA